MILVDDLRRIKHSYNLFGLPVKKDTVWWNKEWCHMVSDKDEDELHAMAARIGLRYHWFQRGRHPHYDLTPARRLQALRLGAAQVSSRELIIRMRNSNT